MMNFILRDLADHDGFCGITIVKCFHLSEQRYKQGQGAYPANEHGQNDDPFGGCIQIGSDAQRQSYSTESRDALKDDLGGVQSGLYYMQQKNR